MATSSKEKALHIAVNISASNGWIYRFKGQDNTVYRILSAGNRSVHPEIVEDCNNH
jgi:hypothetical protein